MKIDILNKYVIASLFLMLLFGTCIGNSHAGILDSLGSWPGEKMAERWTKKNIKNIDLDIASMSWDGSYVFFKGKIHNRTSSKITSAYINLIVQNKQTGTIALTKKIKLMLNVFPSGTQTIDSGGVGLKNGTDCYYCDDIIEAKKQLGDNFSWYDELLYFEHE